VSAKEVIYIKGRERTQGLGFRLAAIIRGPKPKLPTTREVTGEFTEIPKSGFTSQATVRSAM
jgi:hypothetical protein